MVKIGIDNSITNCFRDDLLSFFNAFETELVLDIRNRYSGVRDVDLFEAEFDDSVLESVDEWKVLVCFKELHVLVAELLESVHITRFDTAYNLEVRAQRFFVICVREDLSVWNFTHQQFNNNQKFLHSDSEACSADFGSFSKTLDQTGLGLWVFKLNGFDLANVIQIPCILVVWALFREGRLCDEVTSLFVQVLSKVASDDDVHNSCLTNLVMVETAWFIVAE